ncbi:MAG: PilZ domain-containing protein, partial [Candidatus Acidiferrales bacterium]
MNDSAQSADPGTQKRRSTRIVQAVPITVTGTDALGQPFKERTTTVMVNCHGCKYQSKHYVPKNSIVKLDIPRPEGGPFSTQGRVVWVQRPRTVRELFQIGLEFEAPGNVWGIAFPPEDWTSGANDASDLISEFSLPTDVVTVAEPVASVSPQPLPPIPPPPIPSVPEKRVEAPAAPVKIPAPPASSVAPPPAPPKVTPPSALTAHASTPAPPAAAAPSAPADNKIHVVPPLTSAPETQAALA